MKQNKQKIDWDNLGFDPLPTRSMWKGECSTGDDWIDGKIETTDLLNRLSKTWAGIPNPKTGKSYHQGVGDNQSHVTATSFVDALDGVLKS